MREGRGSRHSAAMNAVPNDAILECGTAASENVESAANCQINLPLTAPVYEIEILDCSGTTSVGDRDAAPLGQFSDEVFVDTLLKALVVGGVDEEFGTVRFEH